MSTSRRPKERAAAAASVSIGFVLGAKPSRVEALRGAFAAVLHAGFGFGSDRPGQVIYSYDLLGEKYAAPELVPAGRHTTLAQALDALAALAPHYNQSIGLSFAGEGTTVPVTGRVYDEPGTLAVNLDFGRAGWKQLVATSHSPRAATSVLVDAGRTLFTLLPARYLLIGPSSLLLELPRVPDPVVLGAVPVAMVAGVNKARISTVGTEHCERLPRGNIVVRRWDAGTLPRLRPAGGPAVQHRSTKRA